MALPPVGVKLVAQDATGFDSALKTAGSVLDGFGKTATAVTSTVNSAFSGMASSVGNALAPIGKLLDHIFVSVIRSVVNDAIHQLERFASAIIEAAIKGTDLETSLSRLGSTMDSISKVAFSGFTMRLNELVERVAPVFLGIALEAEIQLNNLGANALTWGENFVTQFAAGMWAGVGEILQVLTEIANLVTYWLQPGSPPRLLPNIDKWGTAAASEYFGGWTKGAFSWFADLSGTLSNLIRSIPLPKGDQVGVIPQILGARQGIAAAVEELRSTGTIATSTIDAITAAVGTSDTSVRAYLESMIRLQAANATTRLAQDELNKATEKYKELLKPINDEIAGITEEQQQLADEQKKSLLQLILKDPGASASEKRRAALEIERLDAEKNRRALLAAQKVEVEGAQEKLEVAKTAEQLAQDDFDAKRQLIAVQTEQNNLLKEQLRLLESLNKAGGPEKKPGGGGKPEIKPFGVKEFNLDDLIPKDIQEKWKAFTDSLGTLWEEIEEKFQPTIDAINNDLIPAWENLKAAVDEKMPHIKSEIAETFAFMINESAAVGPTMVTNIASAIDSIAEMWRNHGDTIIDAVGFIFRGMFAAALIYLNGMIAGVAISLTALGVVLDVGSLAIQGKWTEAWERIKTGSSDAWEIIKRTADSNLTVLFDLFGLKWSDIKADLITKWDAIKLSLSTAWEGIKTTVKDAIQAVQDKITKRMDELNPKWREQWEEVKTAAAAKLAEVVLDVINKLDEVKDSIAKALIPIQEKWDEIWASVQLSFGKQAEEWAKIGQNIIDGIKKGVDSAVAGLVEAVAKAALAALEAARNALGIDSPSKLAADMIGRPFAAGIAKGILDGIGGIKDAAIMAGMSSLNGQVNGPSSASSAGSVNYGGSTSTSTMTYAPTYVSNAPPPYAGFATMTALFG